MEGPLGVADTRVIRASTRSIGPGRMYGPWTQVSILEDESGNPIDAIPHSLHSAVQIFRGMGHKVHIINGEGRAIVGDLPAGYMPVYDGIAVPTSAVSTST